MAGMVIGVLGAVFLIPGVLMVLSKGEHATIGIVCVAIGVVLSLVGGALSVIENKPSSNKRS